MSAYDLHGPPPQSTAATNTRPPPALVIPPNPLLSLMPPPQLPPPPSFTQAQMHGPPPSPHKVWILDCRSCNTFLTNRSMKAVLLLRPNVPLYSTDAMPVNCSAVAPTPPVTPMRTSSTSSASSTHDRHDAPRTCECLTQTLSCHGCGAQVGYMIVVPCTRCTSSVYPPPPSPAQQSYYQGEIHAYMVQASPQSVRSTNGHRFVFHSSEVVAEERLYIPGEPGVDSDASLDMPEPPEDAQFYVRHDPHRLLTPPGIPLASGANHPSRVNAGADVQDSQADPRLYLPSPSPDSSPVLPNARASTMHSPSSDDPVRRPSSSMRHARVSQGAPDMATDTIPDGRSPPSRHQAPQPQARETFGLVERQSESSRNGPVPSASAELSAVGLQRYARYATISTLLGELNAQANSPSPAISQAFLRSPPLPGRNPNNAQTPRQVRLRAGEVVYWHHLSRRGELPGVCDDNRARSSRGYGVMALSRDDPKLHRARAGVNARGKSTGVEEWDGLARSSHQDHVERGMVVGARVWCAR